MSRGGDNVSDNNLGIAILGLISGLLGALTGLISLLVSTVDKKPKIVIDKLNNYNNYYGDNYLFVYIAISNIRLRQVVITNSILNVNGLKIYSKNFGFKTIEVNLNNHSRYFCEHKDRYVFPIKINPSDYLLGCICFPNSLKLGEKPLNCKLILETNYNKSFSVKLKLNSIQVVYNKFEKLHDEKKTSSDK